MVAIVEAYKPNLSFIGLMPMRGFLLLVRHVCILTFSLLLCSQVLASEYSPSNLHNFDYYQLPNGLRVLLKERRQAKSVSYRVVVNVGMVDYACGRKETPHFLEHLLFTGATSHTESEHDDIIEESGGEWNAFTGEEETIYQIDIFSKHAALGLEALQDILIDSQITPGNVDKSRDILHRESGGKPSILKQWFNELGMGIPGIEVAHQKMLEGTSYGCLRGEVADDIGRPDLQKAKDQYYVANNMTLVVVGDFDSVEMKESIKDSFAKMNSGELNQRAPQIPNPVSDGSILTGTFSPLIGTEALAGGVFTSGGKQSPDYIPWLIIEMYLADRLYKKLRVEEGISYSPSVERMSYSDADIWFVYADTEPSGVEEAVGLIKQEIDQLVAKGISDEELVAIKNKLLISIAQEFESNREFANFYIQSLREFQEFGTLIMKEEKIDAVSADDIQRAAKRVFTKTPPIVFHDTPTLTYTQFIVIISIFMLLVGYFIYRYIFRRVFKHKRSRRI